MGPRIGHKKSRAGCLQCKARRVKCDEQRTPKCGNCSRLGQECSFLHSASSRAPASLSPPPASASISSTATRPSPPSPSAPPPPPPPPLALDDLRLLHHFVTETAPRLSNNASAQRVWATEAVRLAYKDEYLMRAVLAVSALHSAVVYPANASALFAAAEAHIGVGLALSRPHLAALDQDNCNHCFAFSCLVSVYHWALPIYRLTQADSAINSVVQAIRLIRGSFFLAIGSWSWVANGPLSGLIDTEMAPHMMALPEHADQHLLWLAGQAKLPENSPDEQEACIKAVESLRHSLSLTLCSRAAEINYLMMWPAEASPTFLSMLEARRASALIILAYYCPLMEPRGPCAWLFGAWGQRLLDDVISNIKDTVWEQPVQSAADALRHEVISSLHTVHSGSLTNGTFSAV